MLLSFAISCTQKNDYPSLSFDIVRITSDSNRMHSTPIFSEPKVYSDSVVYVYAVNFSDYKAKKNYLLKYTVSADTILTDTICRNTKDKFVEMSIKSEDSIFIVHDNTLQLKNSEGIILWEKTIPSQFKPFAWLCMRVLGNNLLLLNAEGSTLNTEDRLMLYNETRPVLKLSFSGHKDDTSLSVLKFGQYPDIYAKTGNDYHDYDPKLAFVAEDKTCVSFGADHFIYLYQDSVLLKKSKSKSKYIEKFNTIPDEERYNMVLLRKYLAEEPRYMDIIYDKYSDRIYRLAFERRRPANGKTKSRRRVSVMMYDSQLNFLGEEYVPEGVLFQTFVPTPWGILTQQKIDSKYYFCFMKIKQNSN